MTTQTTDQELTLEEQVRKLELQVLHLRKLHASALQMLVKMGRDLLKSQQTLLNAVAEMRIQFETFDVFLKENSAHLPEQTVESSDD